MQTNFLIEFQALQFLNLPNPYRLPMRMGNKHQQNSTQGQW